jgi:cytochrome c553
MMKRRKRTVLDDRKAAHIAIVVATLTILGISKGAYPADIALGEYLSNECVTCHQLSGHGTGGIPPITGLAENHFAEAMQSYKSGERDNEVMRNIAGRLTPEDIAALAAYFAQHGPEQK